MARSPSRLALFTAVLFAIACDGPTTITKPHSDAEEQPPPQPDLAGVGAQADAPEPLQISRSWCDKAACRLVLTFNRPMAKAGQRLSKNVKVAFTPRQSGRWTWLSPTQLQFQPASNALPWGHEISIDVSRAKALDGSTLDAPWAENFRVPYFQAAGKVARWPVIKGRPRFVAFLNGRSDHIGAGPLYLLYDQPVPSRTVARSMRVSHGDSKLKIKVTRPKSIIDLYSGEVDVRTIAAVSVKSLPDEDSEIKLQYPKLLDGDQPEINTRTFTVKKRFGLSNITPQGRGVTGDRVPLWADFRINFDSDVSARQLKQALSISPPANHLSVSWVWGGEAYINASLKPGVTYQLSVAPTLRDDLGNKLGKRHSLEFTAHDLAPHITLPTQPMTLERGHARLPIRTMNASAVKARFQAIKTPADYIALLRSRKLTCKPGARAIERTWTVSNSVGQNNHEQAHDAVLDAGKQGLGCVEITAEGVGSQKASGSLTASTLVQTTGLGVTAKLFADKTVVWVTRLADATPVSAARVRLLDASGKRLSTANTDADGLATLDSSALTQRAGLQDSGYLTVETADDMALAALDERALSQPWQFGLRGDVKDAADLSAVVFTDRGVYRPDETVHLKVIARDADGRMPAKGRVDVTVSNPRGKPLIDRAIDLDRYGSAHVDIPLAKGAAVGRYSIRVAQNDRQVFEKFLVEEYRVPTFQVQVAADQTWAIDGDASATISASYLHGGDLAARQVKYSVARELVPFRPAGFSGFRFGKGFDTRSPAGTIKSGSKRLDGQGRLNVAFKASHPSTVGPMRYVVDASVTDVDRQVYRGRLDRVVHPASMYVGVRPMSNMLMAAGDKLKVPVVAVTTAGKARSGVPVTVRLERIDYHTTARLSGRSAKSKVQVDNRPVIKRVKSCLVRSKQRVVNCEFRVPRSGQYRIVASARDHRQRLVESGYTFTAGGKHTIAWPRFEHERIDVIADKPRYKPGDVAFLMVQSPFRNARGMLTLERAGVLEHRFFSIDGDAPMISVPIKHDHAPNLYASVTLLQPRVHGKQDATGFETGAPSFRMGYTELRVVPDAHDLDVSVASRDTAHPGQVIDVDVAVTDRAGAPVDGQATVMVVDEAVLGLTGYRTPNPIAEIFRRRPLGVRTLASILELPHSRRARHEQIFVSGDGGAGFGLRDLMPQMRSLFKSTAYFNPDVKLGKDGRARVKVTLPDNVTTYRIMAVVASDGSQVGSGDGQVVVRKPLMVQPVVPRFVYPGDKLRVEALVFNGTDDKARVSVSASLSGMAYAGAEGKHAVNVGSGKTHTVGFPARVTGRDEATIRMVATLGKHRDIVEVKVPILNPGSRRRTIVRQPVSGTATLSVDLPAERLPGTASLEVSVSRTRLGQLKESVDYLMGYPNGCIEQTTSRAYPLLVLSDLLPEMGVTVNDDDLRKFAEAGVKRLLSFQTSAGGLAYWPGSDDPHAFGTAFGGAALIEARQRGFDVPDHAMERMAEFLEKSLREGKISEQMPHGGMADADTRALFVMTLGRMGRPQPAYVSALWRKRDKMTAFGLAFLAVAAGELPGSDDAMVEAILADVRAKAKEEAAEAYYEGDPDQGWSMGSPLRTHATALFAHSIAAPDHTMKAKLLTGLLNRQRGGMWGNTQENVFGIMAVAESIKRKLGGNGKSGDMVVAVNDQAQTEFEPMGKHGHRVRIDETGLRGRAGHDAPQSVQIENRGATPLFVTVRADYDVKLTPRTMMARNSGFAVTRSYETVDGQALTKKIPLGSLVRVRVRVKTKAKYNYVAIDDKLPAGLEPLNANLVTTEQVGQAKLSPGMRRGANVLSYSEVRDSRVAFYANELPAGDYEFVYLARATTPGNFLRPAATAEAMYQPDASGASEIDDVVIR